MSYSGKMIVLFRDFVFANQKNGLHFSFFQNFYKIAKKCINAVKTSRHMQKIYNFATFIVSIIRFYKVQYSASNSVREEYRAIMCGEFQ